MMLALGWASAANDGSIVRTSGSLKYVVGAPRGLKSRGGVVMVVGGPTGPPGAAGAWARAMAGKATAPMPAAAIRPRRDRTESVEVCVISSYSQWIVVVVRRGLPGPYW